jgi:TonB family protein
MSVSFVNAQLAGDGGRWFYNEHIKDKETRGKIKEILPTYEAWVKSLEDYISKTSKVGDCNTIGFKLLSNNHRETPNFSYECGVTKDGNIAFLYAKNKIKIGNCVVGSVFKAEFDIRKNELAAFSLPVYDACVFLQPSCRTLISGSCPVKMVFVGGISRVNNFCMGKYEVTQKEWQEVMGNNPSKFQNCGSNCPVEQVSWDDVQAFIRNLNAKTGMKYRLPTEAEWEYAASGGCKSNSQVALNDVAWVGKNSNNQTHAVGSKQPNALGIYDMIGNVKEWVNDWYGKYGGDVDNPDGPNSGTDKVVRGCFYESSNDNCFTKIRNSAPPNTSNGTIGFRLVHPPMNKVLMNVAGLGGSTGGIGGIIGREAKVPLKVSSARDTEAIFRSKAEVLAVVDARMPSLRNIYKEYLKLKPGFSGKVTLKFTIAPSGEVISIVILSSTTGYAEFDNAVKNMVATWKWKAIERGNTTPTIPFNFTE